MSDDESRVTVTHGCTKSLTPPLRAMKFPPPNMSTAPLHHESFMDAAHGSPMGLAQRSLTNPWTPSRTDSELYHAEVVPPPRLNLSASVATAGPFASFRSSSANAAACNNNESCLDPNTPLPARRTPSTPNSTPQLQAVGGMDHAAVDVQGFYSQHHVNGIPLIPQELPSSRVLYVLTTSEGRDKLFKCLQYLLKLLIWVCCTEKLLPEGATPLAKSLAERFAGNVQTIRNGRSMFRLGRWVITLFHVHLVIKRLLKRLAPEFLERVEGLLDRLRELAESAWRSSFRHQKPASVKRPTPQATPPSSSLSLEGSCRRDVPELVADVATRSSLEAPNVGAVAAAAASAIRIGAAEAAVSPTSRQRVVTFPGSNSLSGEENAGQEDITVNGDTEAPLPGTFALPSRWRRSPDDFSTPMMVLLLFRCVLSVARNLSRDALFLNSKAFLHIPMLQGGSSSISLASLQRFTNRCWFAVSLIDLLLNTYRVTLPGWFMYAKARWTTDAHCLCTALEARMAVHRTGQSMTAAHHRRTVAARCTFAPVDMDFGSVTTTTAKFFEAALPEHLKPICSVCGYILTPSSSAAHSTAGSTSPASGASPSMTPVCPAPRDSFFPQEGAMLVPRMVRSILDAIWVCLNHDNLKETLLLQARYFSDTFISYGYAFRDFEPAEGEAPLHQHLHVTGSIAGLLSSLVALRRVVLSAPA